MPQVKRQSAPLGPPPPPPPRRTSAVVRRRRLVAAGLVLIALVAGVFFSWNREEPSPPARRDVPGTPEWAREHYGNPNSRGFKRRNIVEIEFLGRSMFVHRKASRHFLRLARLFEARAPEYAAAVSFGELDDWSYENRTVRGENVTSNHAFGVAVDINALTNILGTPGDMPEEVVSQWEAEGGDWGGDWSRPDPMHFETHLTPEQIRERYLPDGQPRAWYLEELISGG